MVVELGNTVTLEYEGKLETGEVFDSSKHGDHSHPLVFEVGSGEVIKGFDDAVIGMKEGEKKEFVLNPGDAYGERNEKLKREIPRETLPKDQKPKEGMMLMIGTQNGGQFPVRILNVNEDTITVDLNHPLAGKKLVFYIELVKIK